MPISRLHLAPVVALASWAVCAPVEAQGLRDGYRWITVESRWGNGRVSGPVRRGRFKLEVRLPGGTWMECPRSCSETLRMETVDFWQSHGNDAKDPGPGYFRWEFRY